MKEGDLTKQDDFAFHQKEDWRSVHGLWPQIKDYLDRKIPRLNWKATPAALSITADSTWRELDLTSQTSATCFAVILAVRRDDGRWHAFYTRKKGAGGSYEGISAGYFTDSVAGNCTIEEVGSMIIQGVDSGQVLEYKDGSEGASTVHLVGYWDYAKA